MANTNAPFGLRPLRTLDGSTGHPNMTLVNGLLKTDTTKIYTGDPVKRLNTGYVAQWTAGTAVSQMAGIFAGCSYTSTSQGKRVFNNYWPGADAADDPDVFLIPANLAIPRLYVIQTDGTGVAFADIGMNFDIALGTGSTANGRSGAYLDVTTIATTATLPFRLINLFSADMGGAIGPGTQTGAYNWAVVAANVSGAGSTGI